MATRPAKLASNAAAVARRKELGLRQQTFWLQPETVQALEGLREKLGSKDAAVNAAILKLAEG